MNLIDIQFIFNRALSMTFNRTKWLITFIVLALCGLFVVFCRGLASNANSWVALSLTFLPIFLCSGILLALGVILIRSYHDEIKRKEVNYGKILSQSWETMIGAAYFTVPVILLYLMLWMMLGIFILLRSIPVVGDFFAVILAFAPFLINLATLLLCVLVISMLFFVTPVIAFKGLNRSLVTQIMTRRFQADLFSNMTLFLIGILPIGLYIGILLISAFMTGSICSVCEDSLHTVLQWFFIMIPFAALISPAIIFFFNFAAESHVLIQKKLRESM